MQISWNIGKSAQYPAEISQFAYVTTYLHVFKQGHHEHVRTWKKLFNVICIDD